ncbi:MAG: helix-turn-helix transcriptional regulator [Proteobacteria bacterium]|nr:helix-turn-helix transcriptional regulator [Pseudomonadota bacterium]
MSSIASADDNAAFGRRLASVRATTGLNQTNFAATLGLSLRAYANYERGEREAPVALFRALFEQFGIDPIWMLSGTEPTPQRAAARALDFDLVERIDRLIESHLARARKKMKPAQRARVRRALYVLSMEGAALSPTQVEHLMAVAG